MSITMPTVPHTFVYNTTISDTEMNDNFTSIFDVVGDVVDILNASAGTVTDLTARLAVALNTDGTLKTVVAPAGTVSAPGITTTGDTNNGIYFPSADTVAIACNGVQQASITTTGLLTLRSGVKFPATQVASADANALDDYEEGSCSFSVAGGTTPGTYTSSGSGSYTKIGNTVHVEGFALVTAITTPGTGIVKISGLPFVPASTAVSGAITIGGFNTDKTHFVVEPGGGATLAVRYASTAAAGYMDITDITTSFVVTFGITYTV